MSQKTYFFWSPTDRKPGYVFAAGNHGRVIRTYRHYTGDATNGWKLAIEFLMEDVRKRHAPDAPSRLDSAFAFLSEADAKARNTFGAISRLYAVELEDPNQRCHIADFDLYTAICKSDPSQPFVPKTEAFAKDYWAGKFTGIRELLTLSGLRVVSRIA